AAWPPKYGSIPDGYNGTAAFLSHPSRALLARPGSRGTCDARAWWCGEPRERSNPATTASAAIPLIARRDRRGAELSLIMSVQFRNVAALLQVSNFEAGRGHLRRVLAEILGFFLTPTPLVMSTKPLPKSFGRA